MSYLRTRLSGGGEDAQSQQAPGQALDKYKRVGNDVGTVTSLNSNTTNHLANRGRGEGNQFHQGQHQGQPQRGWEPPQGNPGAGQAGIPAEIRNMGGDNDEIRSQVTNSVFGLGGVE
jgi:hypothetical protein